MALYLGSLKLRNEPKKNLKNLKRLAKTQTIATIKIISYYLNIMYFQFKSYFYKFSCRNYTERFNKFIWATFVNHWDLLLRDCSERREKAAKKMTTQKTFKNAYCPTNNASVTNNISRYVIFWNTRN